MTVVILLVAAIVYRVPFEGSLVLLYSSIFCYALAVSGFFTFVMPVVLLPVMPLIQKVKQPECRDEGKRYGQRYKGRPDSGPGAEVDPRKGVNVNVPLPVGRG